MCVLLNLSKLFPSSVAISSKWGAWSQCIQILDANSVENHGEYLGHFKSQCQTEHCSDLSICSDLVMNLDLCSLMILDTSLTLNPSCSLQTIIEDLNDENFTSATQSLPTINVELQHFITTIYLFLGASNMSMPQILTSSFLVVKLLTTETFYLRSHMMGMCLRKITTITRIL